MRGGVEKMLLLGVILALAGAAALIYALVQRGTAEYVLASAFGAEEAAIVDVVLYVGIAVLVLGVILLLVHFFKKPQ